jgi:hypothetical protein
MSQAVHLPDCSFLNQFYTAAAAADYSTYSIVRRYVYIYTYCAGRDEGRACIGNLKVCVRVGHVCTWGYFVCAFDNSLLTL